MAETDKRAAMLLKRFSTLQGQRQTWESHWQEVADYIVPRKADITKKRSSGDKRSELIFDGTAIHAAELMASSLHGMLTNASTPWFALRFTDDSFETDDIAKEWLLSVTDVMYQELHRSNLHEAIHELYSDLVTFGTAVMFIDKDENDALRFSTRHIAECYLAEDEFGRVDTVYREFKMSARAAVRQFGIENVSERIAKCEERDPYEQLRILHLVTPRTDRVAERIDALNKPFASVYLDPEDKVILSESGFDEMPYVVPRFLKASFEHGYGRSPSMTALPDVKMLNKMSETVIRAAQLQIHPPLMIPDDGFISPVRTIPGGLNFYRAGTRDRIEPLNIGANNPLGNDMLEQRRTQIRAAFYVDQLILGNAPGMTATEVIQRTEEKMRLLAPAVGRLQAELLSPMISRVYNILSRRKAYAPAPEFMQSNQIDIEYVSPLAKAQRSGDVQSAMQLFQFLAPLMQIDPSVVDFIDLDGLASHIIKVTNVPATVVRGRQEVAQMRAQRQQQMQQQQQMEQQAMAAQAAGEAAPALRAIEETSPETQAALGQALGL